MKRSGIAALGMMFAVGTAGMVMAGSIDSPGAPGSSASKMPAIGDIYTYLTTGTPAPTPGTSFTEPSSSPAGTGHTIAEVYAAVATPFPQCDATVSNVYSGKKFFCTVAGSWGLKTGTLTQLQYCTLLKTGQTSVYQTGDDASKNKGKAASYTNSGSGLSVIDNVTGLMWAKNAAGAGCCSGSHLAWASAIDWAVGLTFDGYADWRLPNITELQSICLRDESMGSINRTWFLNLSQESHWTSTTSPYTTDNAQDLEFSVTTVNSAAKSNSCRVWAVRGGE